MSFNYLKVAHYLILNFLDKFNKPNDSSSPAINPYMSLLNQQQHSSSAPSQQQQSSQLEQYVSNVLSCLTIMETYTEKETIQINQSQSILPKEDDHENDEYFLQNSQSKTTPFQASLSFIQCRQQYQKENNHNKQQPQQLSQDSSSSSEQEEIIEKTTKLSPHRETLSILKRKKPAYSKMYNQHYKSRQDETVCSTHYTPYHNNNPFNRNNKSTFVRSDSQNKRYNDRRFNKIRTDQDENFNNQNGYGGYQRTESRYEAKREESYQHHRNESYYNNHKQPQQQQQPHIEANGYITNGENAYWNGFYPVQQLDWAQWNWYNRMKYYEYINTAQTVFSPPQLQGFYPPTAVNYAIPTHIPLQSKTIEEHRPSAHKPPKEALSPEKKGKVCNPKFQMSINQCQLIITCSKSITSDILMIPYSVNESSLYPHIKHQDYWLNSDKVDKILTQGKTRNGDVTFIATDRSKIKTIAFLRVPSLKDQTFQTCFNRGLLNLLTTCHPHGNSILIPYSFQFGSSKEKLSKIIAFLQQQPTSFDSLTINCQDMRSFRRMSEGASRCLSSLSEQCLIVY